MTICDVCSAEGYPYDEETCKDCEYNSSKDRKIEMMVNLKELRAKEE